MKQSPNPEINRLVIGTRGSALALWQANAVRDALIARIPDIVVELQVIKPEGDLDKQSSLLQIGGRGVFASALQEALLAGEIDLAVHCTKDVPTIEPVGLVIAAFPDREDARDAVVSRHGVGLAELPPSPVIGTSSRRRAVQVQALRPDATIVELRGNIDTRLRKAESAEYDAVILAAAGLTRMGWQHRITEYLSWDSFVPSPGQGALAIETRVAPDPAYAIAQLLNHEDVALAVNLEREFLRAMGGGCTTPIGAYAHVDGGTVRLWAMVASEDGNRIAVDSRDFASNRTMQDVAGFAGELVQQVGSSSLAQPLSGRHAVVTGTQDMVDRLAIQLEAEGASAIRTATLEIGPSASPDRLATELARVETGTYDWLVLTSRQSVPALGEFGFERLAGKSRIAVVGESTAHAVRELGLPVDLVPEVQDGEGLVAAMARTGVRGARALCLLGDSAGSMVPAGLTTAGATVTRVESYQSQPATHLAPEVRTAVRAGRVDLVLFTSPLSVSTFVALLGADLAALSGACLVAIGTPTSKAMQASGLPVHAIASQPTPEGLVDACREYFAARPGLEAHG